MKCILTKKIRTKFKYEPHILFMNYASLLVRTLKI
jgi:hypothetical protein